MKNIIFMLLVFGCAHSKKDLKSAYKRNLVLIQGVHLDDSSWNSVKNILTHQGYVVSTPNRVGRDDKGRASLHGIAQLSCAQTPEKAVVVAHSYGGAIVNEMVGVCPEKIEGIVYISAVVPFLGEKPFDRMTKYDQNQYARAVDYKRGQLTPKSASQFFKVADRTLVIEPASVPKLYPESIGLTQGTIKHDETVFKSIPKAYIYTLKDDMISAKTQVFFTARGKIKHTSGIQTGHFPMLSNPEALALEIDKHSLKL